MPTRTTVHDWPRNRPDYWAGERGGRPMPTPAPTPLRGDTLPRESRTTYGQGFWNHDSAVAYARKFNCHVQIKSRIIYIDDQPRKRFYVIPSKGRVTVKRNFLGIATKITYKKL